VEEPEIARLENLIERHRESAPLLYPRPTHHFVSP
jgi:hypothetical protein